jgi:hypothetical protein
MRTIASVAALVMSTQIANAQGGILDFIDKACYDAEIERFLDRKTLTVFFGSGLYC